MPPGNKLGVIAREIDGRDVPRANLVIGRLRGRNLPIATAVFAETLTRKLETMRQDRPVIAKNRRERYITGVAQARALTPNH